MSLPAANTRSACLAATVVALAAVLSGCSGGASKPILAPTLKAALQYTPPGLDRTVSFANPVVVGDVIQMDVVIQDSSGTLDIDDVDLVLHYDATFIQITSINGENTLFGTCNTVNPVCGVNSPICADNRRQANGGGSRFCRSKSDQSCTVDADCATWGGVCAPFGDLVASFAVLTGPKVCSNQPAQTCAADSQCNFCLGNESTACVNNADCVGTCDVNNFCTNIPSRGCVSDADCADSCDFGTCQGCPSVVVSGVQRIANLSLRVMRAGTGDIRFVVTPLTGVGSVSAVRKDLVDQAVDFFPKVGGGDGDITITGSL